MGKDNEWYTPYKFIEAARKVMGSIDLDPASCQEANKIVRAAQYYTEQQNGLTLPWHGNVWLNPPYGTTGNNEHAHKGGIHTGDSRIKLFLQRLIASYEDGRIQQATLLCRSDCKASWFHPLWQYPICFCDEDIEFHYPDGTTKHHRFGTVFVYLGPYEQKFIEVFSQFGTLARRIDVPRPIVQPILWSLIPSKSIQVNDEEVSA